MVCAALVFASLHAPGHRGEGGGVSTHGGRRGGGNTGDDAPDRRALSEAENVRIRNNALQRYGASCCAAFCLLLHFSFLVRVILTVAHSGNSEPSWRHRKWVSLICVTVTGVRSWREILDEINRVEK